MPSLSSVAIPVLDIGPLRAGEAGALERLGAELRRAFTEIGFYFVRGHGVPDALVDEVFEAARRFHARPLEAKLAMRFDEHNTGYMPMRGSTTRLNSLGTIYRPNANEAVFLKRELPADHPDVLAGVRFRARNRWPEDLPGFRGTALRYMAAMEALGRMLVPLYAVALGLRADWFDEAFREPMFTLRMTHYPQQDPATAEEEWGLAPHVDTSFMTILAQNRVPGLSLRLPDGTWLDAPAPAGAFLVNGGMLLRRWTNDRFLATPHRVTNRSGQERYAIPFFMDSAFGQVVAPVPTSVDDGHSPRHEPITYSAFMTAYQRTNYGEALAEAERTKQRVEAQGA